MLITFVVTTKCQQKGLSADAVERNLVLLCCIKFFRGGGGRLLVKRSVVGGVWGYSAAHIVDLPLFSFPLAAREHAFSELVFGSLELEKLLLRQDFGKLVVVFCFDFAFAHLSLR